jgi:hypothetical protein
MEDLNLAMTFHQAGKLANSAALKAQQASLKAQQASGMTGSSDQYRRLMADAIQDLANAVGELAREHSRSNPGG